MIKKLVFIIVILFLAIFPNTVEASENISEVKVIPFKSDIYTEGFYHFDLAERVDINIMLTNDVASSLMLLDENKNISLLTKMPYNYEFKVVDVKPGEIIGIVGEGKVAISFEPHTSN